MRNEWARVDLVGRHWWTPELRAGDVRAPEVARLGGAVASARADSERLLSERCATGWRIVATVPGRAPTAAGQIARLGELHELHHERWTVFLSRRADVDPEERVGGNGSVELAPVADVDGAAELHHVGPLLRELRQRWLRR
jgi:hypothetical protein